MKNFHSTNIPTPSNEEEMQNYIKEKLIPIVNKFVANHTGRKFKKEDIEELYEDLNNSLHNDSIIADKTIMSQDIKREMAENTVNTLNKTDQLSFVNKLIHSFGMLCNKIGLKKIGNACLKYTQTINLQNSIDDIATEVASTKEIAKNQNIETEKPKIIQQTSKEKEVENNVSLQNERQIKQAETNTTDISSKDKRNKLMESIRNQPKRETIQEKETIIQKQEQVRAETNTTDISSKDKRNKLMESIRNQPKRETIQEKETIIQKQEQVRAETNTTDISSKDKRNKLMESIRNQPKRETIQEKETIIQKQEQVRAETNTTDISSKDKRNKLMESIRNQPKRETIQEKEKSSTEKIQDVKPKSPFMGNDLAEQLQKQKEKVMQKRKQVEVKQLVQNTEPKKQSFQDMIKEKVGLRRNLVSDDYDSDSEEELDSDWEFDDKKEQEQKSKPTQPQQEKVKTEPKIVNPDVKSIKAKKFSRSPNFLQEIIQGKELKSTNLNIDGLKYTPKEKTATESLLNKMSIPIKSKQEREQEQQQQMKETMNKMSTEGEKLNYLYSAVINGEKDKVKAIIEVGDKVVFNDENNQKVYNAAQKASDRVSPIKKPIIKHALDQLVQSTNIKIEGPKLQR